MLKKIMLGFVALVVLTVLVVGWRVWPIYELAQEISPSTAAEDYAEQDDSRVELPTPLELDPRPYDPLKNVYWGELHVHTTESLDAVLFGTTATVEDAYRFARGEPCEAREVNSCSCRGHSISWLSPIMRKASVCAYVVESRVWV